VSEFPNIARLVQADPAELTSRQLQIHVIRQDYEKSARGTMHQVDKDARMAAAVPALLAHINELYGEIATLRDRNGRQADMLACHRTTRDEVLAILDRFNTVPADDVIAETLIDSARNLLGGAR
jgi:hypothetical protein